MICAPSLAASQKSARKGKSVKKIIFKKYFKIGIALPLHIVGDEKWSINSGPIQSSTALWLLCHHM